MKEKYLINTTWIYRLVCLLSFMFSSHIHANEVWKVAALSWEPYAGENLTQQGQSIEKLRAILARQNITLIVEFYPWNRAKLLVKHKKEYLGVFPAWPEDTFEGAINSPAIDWSEISILKASNKDISFKTIDDLFANYRVGVIDTYIYPDKIEKAIKKYPHNIEGAPDELSLMRKLSVGRGDVAITDPKVMLFLAEQNDVSNIEVVSTIMHKELVLAFRDDKENRQRLKALRQFLANASM